MTQRGSTKRASAAQARKRFAEFLVEKRRLLGYESAYGFFHDRGGRRLFGFSYQQYLRIEKGSRLPSVTGLGAILNALGGTFESSSLELRLEFLVAYTRALVDAEPVFDPLFALVASLNRPAPPAAQEQSLSEELATAAANKLDKSLPVASFEQTRALFDSAAAFWLFMHLTSTGLEASEGELARDLNLPSTETAAAARRLCALKLLERTAEQRYRSPYFETDICLWGPPSEEEAKREDLMVSRWMQDRAALPDAQLSYAFRFLTLNNPQQLASVVQLLRDAFHKIGVLRSPRVSETSDQVSVEYRVCTRRISSTPSKS